MSTILPNGAVIPFGLLSVQDRESKVAAFNRSYKNTGIKAGFVVASYDTTDDKNQTKLSTEYDVRTVEQFENKGTTAILYRNCLSSQSFGGIADYLEFTLRAQTYEGKNAPSFAKQDGAIVLIQCLDNIGSKAIVVGCLEHPDRKTNITSTEPQLFGEYNGIAVQINTDGSASLIFNGATDSKGKVIDSSQNSTTLQIQKDGTLTILDANGTLLSTDKNGSIQSLTSNGNSIFLNNEANEVSVTQKDGNTIGMNSKGVTISDATGKQIIAIDDSTVQLTSGGTMVEQSTGHTINSGSVNISGLGGISAKDGIGGALVIKNGMVALGGPAAELLDLFSQTLQQLSTLMISLTTAFATPAIPLSPLDPAWAASAAPIQVQLALITVLLTTIKGSL